MNQWGTIWESSSKSVNEAWALTLKQPRYMLCACTLCYSGIGAGIPQVCKREIASPLSKFKSLRGRDTDWEANVYAKVREEPVQNSTQGTRYWCNSHFWRVIANFWSEARSRERGLAFIGKAERDGQLHSLLLGSYSWCVYKIIQNWLRGHFKTLCEQQKQIEVGRWIVLSLTGKISLGC